jgi:membrane-bound lytic murein transglycosylase B
LRNLIALVLGLVLALALCWTAGGLALADPLDPKLVEPFIAQMVDRHGFSRAGLETLFGQVERSERVLAAISKPAEAKPWYSYRRIFVTPERIRLGVEFWRRHGDILERVAAHYGVAPEILVAIVGVETYYGANTGDYRVVDALSSLAFYFPSRAPFFTSELEAFLLMTRDQKLDPLMLKGSYAGAMGMPQFIPTSYRRYAVDFDADGRSDIWRSVPDVLASIANYFKEHGWEAGQPVAVPARVTGDAYQPLLYAGKAPEIGLEAFARAGVVPQTPVAGRPKALLVALDSEAGKEFWVGLMNFYVITRYSHSASYAMAVFQLAQAIRDHARGDQAAGISTIDQIGVSLVASRAKEPGVGDNNSNEWAIDGGARH